MKRPTFLVTNDDGMQVFFLHALVNALSELGTVFVAAPKSEQSWVGRGLSRNRDVRVNDYHGFSNARAWEIDGTPSDAVNIALGNLMPQKPDVVVSGINVGWNAMAPVIFSSGTVAGALEGASWGLPAVALSMHMVAKDFDDLKNNPAAPSANLTSGVRTAARLGAEFAAKKAGETNENCEVYNVNFPTNPQMDTPWVATQPEKVRFGSLFEETESGVYNFRYTEHIPYGKTGNLPNDWETFAAGNISLSILNFHNLGRHFSL
jgi:5'-nucleotidase